MTEVIRQRLNDSPFARWTVLFIVATAMMMGYFVNDVMSPLETMLEASKEDGGLGWSSSDYGFFSGSSGLINVFLLMLFFSGLILDKMGIRFTGTLACSLMVIGTLIKFMAITQDFDTVHIPIFDTDMSGSVACASLGFAIFGVGYEMTGITVSKAMVRWFTGHELALAMGIQLAMARLGTAAALSISAPIARHFTLSTPLLLSLAFLMIGLLAFLVFCVMDRRLDASIPSETGNSEEFRLSDIGVTLRNPGFWLITLFCVLFYSARTFLFSRLAVPEVLHETDGHEVWCGCRYCRFLFIDCTFWYDSDDTTFRTYLRSLRKRRHTCHHRCLDADCRSFRLLTADT